MSTIYSTVKNNALCFVDTTDGTTNIEKVSIKCEVDNQLNFVGDNDAAVQLKNIAAPTLSSDVATKQFVTDLVYGLNWKAPVKAAQDNLPLNQSVDGQTIQPGERILVLNDTDGKNNGIWVYNGTTSSYERPEDFATGSIAANTSVWVQRVAADNIDRCYVITSDVNASTVDTHNLDIVPFAKGAGTDAVLQNPTSTQTITGHPLIIADTTGSTDKDTGALVVNGGVGIEENLNVGGNVTVDNTGQLFVNATASASNTDSNQGAAVITGGLSVKSNAVVNDGFTVKTDTEADGSNEVGAITVSSGGIYVKKNTVIAGDTMVNSTSATTGTLVIESGGAGITGDIHCNGALTCSGVGSFLSTTNTSDERLKTDIETIKPSEKFDRIQPVSYNWKQTATKSNGVLAQQIQPLFPEMVKENEEGMLSVDYNQLIGILIAEVQDLKKKLGN